jgi:GT2 family glycosyltransferase
VEESTGPVLDLVIVNYRSYDELTRCLSSLEAARPLFARVVVIDHESDLRAADRVSRQFPWVDVVERTTNEGFATGVNLGVRSGRAPFVLLLNPDCVADVAALAGLLAFAATRPDAAVIGPRILNLDGTVQGSARRFPGPSTMFAGRSSWLTRRFPNNPLSRWNLPGRDRTAAAMTVDWVSGACMLVRRQAFEQVGGMDERFFLYWEDADLCRRLSARGWAIVYYPDVAIVHAGGRSSIHVYAESLAAFHRSAYVLFRKHASGYLQALAPLVYLALHARLRLLLYIHRRALASAGGGAGSRADRAAPAAGIPGWTAIGGGDRAPVRAVPHKDSGD